MFKNGDAVYLVRLPKIGKWACGAEGTKQVVFTRKERLFFDYHVNFDGYKEPACLVRTKGGFGLTVPISCLSRTPRPTIVI